MKEKNIAVEILRKLMAEQVSVFKRTNVVQSQKFSEKIAQLMNAYYNGLITNEEVIKELLDKDFYKNDQLVAMTRELTEMLRKNRTIDWQRKETARAGMRKMVKRLLKKYDYPPEGVEDAINTVISQCEMWTDNAPA